jgi:hypothetical protein
MPQQTKLITVPGLDHVKDVPENIKIAISDNNVYVVSWDKRTGNGEVFLARSTDNGEKPKLLMTILSTFLCQHGSLLRKNL